MENEYRELLDLKLDVLEKMYENTVRQREMLMRKNEKILLTLLENRQKLMNRLSSVMARIEEFDYKENSEYEIKQRIDIVVKGLNEVNQENYVNMQIYIDEVKESLKEININKKAILGGYFKRSSQVYGYFVDSKR